MGNLFCARRLVKGLGWERAKVSKLLRAGKWKRGWRGEVFGGMEGLERRVYLSGDSNVEHRSGTIFEASRSTATQLVITLQPDSFYGVGDYFNIAATAEDAAGNIVTNQLTVTVKIASGPDGAVVGGGTAVTSVNGVATFMNITLHTAGTYTLEVDEIGLAAGITQSFVEEPGEATQLVFSQAPTGGVAESADTSGGIVTAEDTFGNVAAFDEEPITLTLNGSGGNRTLTAQAVDGVADFSGDRLGVAGTYTLTASSADPTINSVTSGNITVTAGAAAKLGWGDEPTGTAVGRGVDLRVWVEDADGNLVTTDTSSVTLSINSGPAGALPAGTLTVAAVNGVATFTSDFLSEVGEYTLAATDDALDEGVSSIFDVTAPVAILGDFNGANGANPEGKLLADSKGNLYGTTYSGGANNDGTVFEIVQGSGVVKTLATFTGDNGANPVSGLAMDHAGNLYGTTEKGGVNGSGTVFELAKGSTTIKTLATFNGANGYAPWGGIVMDSSGNLFGTTGWGGSFNDGEIFELAKGKGEIKVLASFDGQNGVNPLGDLLLDKSGNLYGTTFGQANQTIGSVFKLAKGSNTVTVLGTFDDTGPAPMGGLVMDKKGNIFGVTDVDTRSGNSFIFEVTKSGEFLTLASVAGTIVARPEAGLMIDAEGNLYGASTYGGTNDVGGIFELPVGSSTIRMLTSFEGNIEGAYPVGTPISNGHGAIFGTTYGGGSGQNGTVFSFNLPTTIPQAIKLATKPVTIGQGEGASQGQIQVAITDAHGKALANGTYSVALSLVSVPKGVDWAFSPMSVTTVNGVATFDVDDLPAVAGKYVFSASNWGIGTATVTIQEKKEVAAKTLRTHT